MATLLDLDATPPRKTKVTVRGVELGVGALTADDFVYLVGAAAGFEGTLEESVMSALSELIACGAGLRGHAEAIAIAKDLMPSDQAAIAKTIVDLTFPDGLRAFVDQLKSLGGTAKPPAKELIAEQNT